MSSLENTPQLKQERTDRTRGDGGMLNTLRNGEHSTEKGPKYWKSLGELSESAEYQKFVEREFPENASELLDPVSRRSFLGVMAASMALAGVTGCGAIRRPEEKILPYNNQPESLIPGKPTYYATFSGRGQDVVGLVVETHEGRPTKVEGNDAHPASLGATRAYHQAEVLGLYAPDRNQSPMLQGNASSWNAFWSDFGKQLEKYQENQGEGLRFLSEYITSPSTAALKQKILAAYPKAKWHTYEAINQDNVEQGIKAATGQNLSVHYDMEQAHRVLAIGCDFLGTELNSLKNTKGFVKTRDTEDKKQMSRLYALESDHTITGAKADHRFKLKPSELRKSLWVIADVLFNKMGLPLPSGVGADYKALIQKAAKTSHTLGNANWVRPMCEDLLQNGTRSLVCVGKYQDPAIHALAHVINAALGGAGKTVHYKPHATARFNDEESSNNVGSLHDLSLAMEKGEVESLVILGGNPVFLAPSDIPFGKSLENVAETVYFGLEKNETAVKSKWILPRSHFMEEWTDGLATDGTASIGQPMIAPLYDTLGTSEMLASVLEKGPVKGGVKGREIVENYWKERYTGVSFSSVWKRWLHDGIQKGSANKNISAGIRYSTLKDISKAQISSIQSSKVGELEVLFQEHPIQYDGRYADNGWLQELPDAMTRLTWDNAAIVSITTAEKYGLKDKMLVQDGHGVPLGQNNMPIVQVKVGDNTLKMPVYVLPGLSDDTILLNMGYGRTEAGRVGKDTGFDVSVLQTSDAYFSNYDVSWTATEETYPLATTQEHWSMEGRDLARVESTLEDGHHDEHHGHELGAYPSLFQEQDYSEGMQWGMAIDLNKCIGCGDCVVACQAENNIPVVGKEQVILNREMHWVRMDRYFTGDNPDEPQVVHQAVGCQHCEMAPCETVCPVAATVHSSEGLNDMAYNRCIGTRYCSNNCPYKVRRFNFFNYTNEYTETEKMVQNPDVTVRFRGVMEKCTYCVQRINEARIEYKNKGVEWIPDGAISVACAQSCAAEAVVFGNINDPKSQVAKWKQNERNYDLLAALNTRPRTSYLARVVNPNPKIEGSHAANHKEHSNHSKH
jgi:molybdopterin-containing oxidoreductase family iron-sulfur binding subunit